MSVHLYLYYFLTRVTKRLAVSCFYTFYCKYATAPFISIGFNISCHLWFNNTSSLQLFSCIHCISKKMYRIIVSESQCPYWMFSFLKYKTLKIWLETRFFAWIWSQCQHLALYPVFLFGLLLDLVAVSSIVIKSVRWSATLTSPLIQSKVLYSMLKLGNRYGSTRRSTLTESFLLV